MRYRAKQKRRGVAAVELAILLPFLCFLFAIAADYGRIFFFSLTLTNCARNGAMYASDPVAAANSPYLSIQEAALAETTDLATPPTVTSTNGIDDTLNPYVEVTAVWEFRAITKFPGVPSTTTISRTVRTRVAPTSPKI